MPRVEIGWNGWRGLGGPGGEARQAEQDEEQEQPVRHPGDGSTQGKYPRIVLTSTPGRLTLRSTSRNPSLPLVFVDW